LLLVAALAACASDPAPRGDALADGGPADISAYEAGADAPVGDAQPVDPARVQTSAGPVRGTVQLRSRAFLGIPYAAPPVGALRWARPAPAPPWTAERDVTRHGPSCPQPEVKLVSLPAVRDEDCLLLSVWTPNPAPSRAPVMVYFHGGGFVSGGSAAPSLDGSHLAAERGVVVVGVSYRLGSLGFFAHPALPEGGLSYGILDQQAALRWVQTNIAAFGGAPDDVTIFGQSAGALSVSLHLVAPGSAGLFRRAVVQSGAWLAPVPTRARYAALSQRVVEAVGCQAAADVLGCLRAKPAQALATALPMPPGIVFGAGAIALPFLDGVTLAEQPPQALAAGRLARVPVLLGTTRNEGSMFVVGLGVVGLTEADYAAQVTELIAPADPMGKGDPFGIYYPALDPAAVLAAYPAAAFSSPAEALSELLTDGLFVCPTRAAARAITAAGQSAYLYQFTYGPAYYKAIDPFYRVAHGAELPFVFGNHPLGISLTGAEKDLAAQVMGYWTRFARAGEPNGEQAVLWPAYDVTDELHQVLDVTPGTTHALKKDKCDFWDTQVAAKR
jgi:para-nitrobenzyl esterase